MMVFSAASKADIVFFIADFSGAAAGGCGCAAAGCCAGMVDLR